MALSKWMKLLIVALVGLTFSRRALAEPPATPAEPAIKKVRKPAATKFMRVKRDQRGEPVSLQTATVRYVPPGGEAGVYVDLVSVVHVADRPYYEQLNDQFEQYDVLLYELVAPPGARIPKGGRPAADNPLALIQQGMKAVMGLELQTDVIDYTKKNFVHADLSPQQMAEKIRKRGDDGLTITLGVMADLLRQHNRQLAEAERQPKRGPAEESDPLAMLLDPVKLKRSMAEQFDTLEEGGGLGKTLDTILVRDRNQAAMRVFGKQLVKGKKRIGIFYGAAHMPDFEKRLKTDYDLKRQSVQWQTAWDLTERPAGGLEGLLKLLGPELLEPPR